MYLKHPQSQVHNVYVFYRVISNRAHIINIIAHSLNSFRKHVRASKTTHIANADRQMNINNLVFNLLIRVCYVCCTVRHPVRTLITFDKLFAAAIATMIIPPSRKLVKLCSCLQLNDKY